MGDLINTPDVDEIRNQLTLLRELPSSVGLLVEEAARLFCEHGNLYPKRLWKPSSDTMTLSPRPATSCLQCSKPRLQTRRLQPVPTVFIGGLPTAVLGSLATCAGGPATVIPGSATVLIDELPAARVGDQTAHGGTIVPHGCPTVMIEG